MPKCRITDLKTGGYYWAVKVLISHLVFPPKLTLRYLTPSLVQNCWPAAFRTMYIEVQEAAILKRNSPGL